MTAKPKPPTATRRLAAAEAALQAIEGRLARVEERHQAKAPAAVDDVVRCHVCGTSIAPTMLARAEVLGISVSTTPDGEQVVLCSATCSRTHEGSSR
jgi:hypothetical protein